MANVASDTAIWSNNKMRAFGKTLAAIALFTVLPLAAQATPIQVEGGETSVLSEKGSRDGKLEKKKVPVSVFLSLNV